MIQTKFGAIEGIQKEGYMQYLGIPYAKPPVGELRWKAPVEPEAWDGVYSATAFTSRCVQEDFDGPDDEGDNLYGREFYSNPDFRRSMSEDCLYLHIWAPDNAEEPLPVAIWFHGGAFMGGFASELEFDGEEYCRRGVILVSVEYRCNVFGFLAHPWLSEENERGISGNYGILDQIAALRWVYENIAAFGGNPNNITVFGQSAGAMSVQTLVSSPLTGNMIAKAIMQSGGSYGVGLHRDLPLSDQEHYGEIFSEVLGVSNLEEMRSCPVETIQKAMKPFMGKVFPMTKGLFLTPTLDGYVLDDNYYKIIDDGRLKNIPYLLGSTKDDILVDPKNNERDASPLYNGVKQFCETLDELHQGPCYAYYFSRDLPGSDHGAFHSSELWYTFGTLGRCWRPMEEHDYALSKEMLDHWTHFMKYGKPMENWKAYTKEEPFIKEFK